MTKGYIHSIENGSMIDGPGVRFVIFFSGCPLRCQYCHNPDTWELKSGKEIELNEIISQIKSASKFLKIAKGGVTITGGEPLMQPKFLLEILKECKQLGLHTAIDTSGFLVQNLSKEILENTDLFLLDIKSFNPKTYEKITSKVLAPTLEFLNILEENNKATWIRFVLVTNLSDNLVDIEKMVKYLKNKSNVELVEILPFHKMGEFKWNNLGLDYQLKNTRPPSAELIKKVRDIFKSKGLMVRI